MSDVSYVQKVSGKHFEIEVWVDPMNKRLRVDDYRGDVSALIQEVLQMAKKLKKEKVICIVRQEHFNFFLQSGFQCEAKVDGFFRGSDAYYFTKYFNDDRRKSDDWLMEDGILERVWNLTVTRRSNLMLPKNYILQRMEKRKATALSKLYLEVFKIYPTPLHDPDYIQKTMDSGTIYYGCIYDGEIVSCASAEINSLYCNAELTDCATLPKHRKYGLMKKVLETLEIELKQQGIYCAYSIARAQVFGMNAVLHQLGYQYSGRLMKNCFIFDKLEDMNMWVKDLSEV